MNEGVAPFDSESDIFHDLPPILPDILQAELDNSFSKIATRTQPSTSMPPPPLPISTKVPPMQSTSTQPAHTAIARLASKNTAKRAQQRIRELETKNKDLCVNGKALQDALIDLKSRFDAAAKAGIWLQNQLHVLMAASEKAYEYQEKLEHEKATLTEQNSLLWSYISQTVTQRYEQPNLEEMRAIFTPITGSHESSELAQQEAAQDGNSQSLQQRPKI